MSNVHDVMPAARTILAIDLGKFKSVACVLDAAAGTHRFETIVTSPATVHDLLVAVTPDRLVIEACSVAGWVHDSAVALSVPVQVANTNGEAWHYKRVKRKTDRDDALKLTKLSLLNELPTVHMPPPATRQWKSLIKYRHALIDRRTGIKNTIRSLLDSQGLSMPGRGGGGRGWTDGSIAELKLMSKKLIDCGPLEFWKGQLEIELRALSAAVELIAEADQKLNAIGSADQQVRRLRTIPQVGPRLAELVVSTLGDPKRFRNAGQVSAYAGLVPKQFQSGTMNHQGRITGQGGPGAGAAAAGAGAGGVGHAASRWTGEAGVRAVVPRSEDPAETGGGDVVAEDPGLVLGDAAGRHRVDRPDGRGRDIGSTRGGRDGVVSRYAGK